MRQSLLHPEFQNPMPSVGQVLRTYAECMNSLHTRLDDHFVHCCRTSFRMRAFADLTSDQREKRLLQAVTVRLPKRYVNMPCPTKSEKHCLHSEHGAISTLQHTCRANTPGYDSLRNLRQLSDYMMSTLQHTCSTNKTGLLFSNAPVEIVKLINGKATIAACLRNLRQLYDYVRYDSCLLTQLKALDPAGHQRETCSHRKGLQ